MKKFFSIIFLGFLFSINVYNQSLEPCLNEKRNLWGFCKNGKNGIDYQFDWADAFQGGVAIVGKNGKSTIINEKGKLLVEPKFDELIFCSEIENTILARIGQTWAIMNNQGKLITPFYKLADSYYSAFNIDGYSYASQSDIYRVLNDDKMALFNMKGEMVFDFKYEFILPVPIVCKNVTSMIFLVKEKDDYFFVDKKQLILSNGLKVQDYYSLWKESIIAVQKDGKLQFIDICTGALTQHIANIGGSNANVLMNADGKQGLVDINGKIVLPFIYDNISYDGTNTYFNICVDGKCGVADTNGVIYLDLLYNSIGIVCMGGEDIKKFPSQVVKDGLSAIFIYSEKEKKLIPKTDFIYTSVSCNSIDENGLTAVVTDTAGREGILDNNGNVIMK